MKIKLFGVLAVSLFFVACQQEAEPLVQESVLMEFVAHLYEEPSSKTARQADGKVFWSPNEEIQVFQGNRKGKFISQNEDVSAMATFEGKMNRAEDDGSDYWAVYPYDDGSTFGDWYVTVPILPYQQAKASTFANGVFPVVAKSSTNNLSFLNVCGGIKFSVYHPGIKQVIFKGNKDEAIAGSAIVAIEEGRPVIKDILSSTTVQISSRIRVVAPDSGGFVVGEDYYIVIPPMQFPEGFSLTFCDVNNQEAVFSTNKSVTVTRSKFGVLRDLDKDLSFTEGNEARVAAEREILVDIYNALNGKNWTEQTNWLSDSPVGKWDGVTTNDEGRIVALSLYDSNLDGSFPSEICELDQLQELFISGQVSGSVPSTINLLSRLRTLRIGSPVFGGIIPDGICDLDELECLSITYCQITGTLPENIGNLSNLKLIDLTGFDGPLPESFANLTQLEYLSFNEAHLNQAFPDEVFGFTNLTNLALVSCGLTGSIPEGFDALSRLERLELSSNDFTGAIPSSIGTLENLKELIVGGNAFNAMPEMLSQCAQLESIDISNNRDNILFSNMLWNAPRLSNVYLSNSNFTGNLTEAMGNATNLKHVDLSSNAFSGTLPSSIANLTLLEVMDLHRNQFTGNLPDNWSKMQSLNHLDIHNNSFTGSLPESFKDLASLSQFYAYNNYMSGSISEEIVFLDAFSNWQLTPQYGDGVFSYSLYESSDYSMHKQVSLLHPAIKGPGINIVFMGDAFTDRDIANGDYDYAMNLACEAMFEVEPFASYEDYFNVYSVTLVSKNGHYVGETALNINYDSILGSNGYSGLNMTSSRELLKELIPGVDTEQLTVGIIVNRIPNGGACDYLTVDAHFSTPADPNDTPYGSGLSFGIIPNRYVNGTDGISLFKFTVLHEIGGHGFGKLGDEYVTDECMVSEDTVNYLNLYHQFGFYRNLSTSIETNQIPWASFLTNSDYTAEGIGLYEGGFSVSNGLWRSTEASIMSCNYDIAPYFNAPSREAIYRRINLIVNGRDWFYDFDEFLEWDARNIGNN